MSDEARKAEARKALEVYRDAHRTDSQTRRDFWDKLTLAAQQRTATRKKFLALQGVRLQ